MSEAILMSRCDYQNKLLVSGYLREIKFKNNKDDILIPSDIVDLLGAWCQTDYVYLIEHDGGTLWRIDLNRCLEQYG